LTLNYDVEILNYFQPVTAGRIKSVTRALLVIVVNGKKHTGIWHTGIILLPHYYV
jgi:hypothetical protein